MELSLPNSPEAGRPVGDDNSLQSAQPVVSRYRVFRLKDSSMVGLDHAEASLVMQFV
jgi:hypothetical protein